jgi:hypothetical protein
MRIFGAKYKRKSAVCRPITKVPTSSEKYGEVPDKLTIDYEERTEYYHLKEEGLIEEEDEFKDALVQDWWSSTILQPIEIIHQIDKKVRRADYGSDTCVNWKFDNGKVDNDASMSISEETGKIEEIRFREDLREDKMKFLNEMIELAEKYHWLLMDINGNLVEPNFHEVAKLIKDSNSYKFLKDPLSYLTDLQEGRINLE